MPLPVKYLTTLDLSVEWLEALAQACPHLQIQQQVASHPDEIDNEVWATIDILHTGNVLPAPSRVPRLRWIQLDTSGVEHVMTHQLWETDVEITTLGGIAPVPMAEFTVMSLLGLAHHLTALTEWRHNRVWPSTQERLANLTPLPVDGATATIIGHGRIGREVARLLHALGMRVIGVSRRGADKSTEPGMYYDTGRVTEGAEPVELRSVAELSDVLSRTDYLIVIAPRTTATIGLIGAAQLAGLKPGACVINVSRGGVVDEDALLAGLRSRHVRYASLDVFEEEPLSEESVWWSEPHTLITPHVAGLAPRYADQVLDLLSTNILRYQAGIPLLNRADRATGY